MSRLDQFSTRPENSTVAVLRHAQKHKVSRAPMVNPYDKFTQPEFDAWIGDITSSLRRALGFELDEPPSLEKIHVNVAANGNIPVYPQLDLSDQDDAPDDSFAQIRSRRDKGKARDPREGPGLGRDRAQPIQVVSSDEEEEDEVKDLAFSLRDNDPDIYDQSGDAESDYSWERSSPSNPMLSSPLRIGPPIRSRPKSEVEDTNAGSADDSNSEYEDDDEDSVNRANNTSEVISISSDEDESVGDEYENHREFDYDRPGPSFSRHPRDESDEELNADDENDEIQPLVDDTSFPPPHSSPPRNLELNDPWAAPRKYAEDFYSGGNLHLSAGARVHPDQLGPLDEGIEEDEELSRLDETDHCNETSSNLEFYQALCYEGNTIKSWDQQLDPRFFAHAEELDSDIDSFLTPGVVTPNPIEIRTHLNGTESAVETGFIHERAQSLSLPKLTSVLPSKRNEPIPQDAEIIAVDDSDEDGEDGVEVIPPLDAILQMVMEAATVHPEGPEMSETNDSAPFVPNVKIFDQVGEDDVLSVHTAHTEDIEHESHLQPFEIVEVEGVAMTSDLGPVSSEVNDLELYNPYDVEITEPEVMVLKAVDTLPLLAEPNPMTVGVDEQAPNYYEDFDDIYETPVPETLPPGPEVQPAELVALSGTQTSAHEDANFSIDNLVSQDVEVEDSQDRLAACSAGNAGPEVNNKADVSSMGGHPQWLQNKGVVFNDIFSESTIDGSFLETSRLGPMSVYVQNLGRSATPNGLRNALSSPGVEEPLPKKAEFTTETLPVLLSPSRTSVPGQPKIPMPVMADENVPDPTESPTRLQEHAILSIPGTPDITVTPLQIPQIAEELVPTYPPFLLGPLLRSLNPNADGLFTPADFSTTTTPAEDSSAAMLPSEWQETSSNTMAPVDLHPQAELTDKLPAPSFKEVSDILTEADITRRKSVLMPDPYPYCLSTPIVSDYGSSEENDDNSISSHSSEKEGEMVEAFSLAADIEPHSNTQPELQDSSAPLTEFDLQAMTTSTQNLLDYTIEELGILPALNENDAIVAMELQYPFPPTMGLKDSPTILADASGKDPQEQVTVPSLESGVDADLQTFVQENPEGYPEGPLEEKEETLSTIPEDSHLPSAYKDEGISQANAISPESRPSKRKREISPDPDRSDGFSVKGKGKLPAKSKRKMRGKEPETDIVEHDTIYVSSRPSPKHRTRDSATPELSANLAQDRTSADAGVSHLADKAPTLTKADPPFPQYHAPSLFHAHGRAKRQKAHIQPIASVKQMRDGEDQSASQSTTQHTLVLEKPPSPPTAEGSIATEVRQAAQSAALLSAELTDFDSSTVVTTVPAVELPAEDTFPQPSSTAPVSPEEHSQPTHSTPTATVALPPIPSLQSSPARFLQASGSTSSIRSTRSQCKYHKIALPIGESGRRVRFLVPGCSLTNQELMVEEAIEDHGEATYEDSLRIIQNIDHLDFDQYLIGILRQLVGLDILREGEVFYLPQPGDDVPRKHWPRRSISEKTSMAKGSDYTFAGSPGYSYSGSTRSPSTRPPLSNADSVFTSVSGIATADDGSDMGNNWSPSKGKRNTNTWKGKTKDITFQPNEHYEQSPDEESTQKTRRKSNKRGVKRTRTLDGAMDGTRKSKRLRPHLTDSSLHEAQQHD